MPGDFGPGKNYLEFSTAAQCVDRAVSLFENADARERMMENNYQYYKEYLAPDKLIWRTLEIVVSGAL